jgi:pimeloyl-ACP methyl ester carboxylesterase
MPPPSMLQSHSFKRLAQGAAVGAVATMIIGFSWGGWSVESTAAKRADEASRTAVVAVLAPICVDKFQHSADATNNFIELKKVSTYMQGSFVEKGGWATSPGSDKANSAVAQACATMLGNLK